MLLHRLITILILVPIVVATVLYAHLWQFEIILAVFLGLGIWEWAGLIDYGSTKQRLIYLTGMLVILFIFTTLPIKPILWLGLLFWLSPLYFFFRYQDWFKCWGSSIYMRAVTGIFVFVPCWMGFRYLHQRPGLIIFVLFLIWFADSGAYVVGKKFGKHKLIPAVSPGKTWEGLAGGLLAAFLITIIGALCLRLPLMSWPGFIILSLLTALISVVGDLFESMVKRFSGMKDSGSLLPGHGGMLDRIDSALAAVPFFALGISLLH